MNKWLALLTGLLMMGCAIEVTPPTADQVKMQTHTEEVRMTCYQAIQAGLIADANLMANVPAESRTMVVLLNQQGEFSKQMLSLATGRSLDPCAGGTNYYDVQVAELKAKGDMAGRYIDGTLGLAKWVVGGYTVAAILDRAGGDVYTATGGSTIDMYSKNQGSFNKDISGSISGSNNPVTQTTVDNRVCTDCEDDSIVDNDNASIQVVPPFDLDACLADPPNGWDSGHPMYAPGCSCQSFDEGHC